MMNAIKRINILKLFKPSHPDGEIKQGKKNNDNNKNNRNDIDHWTANYFQLAGSWADDIYTRTVLSRNRWRATSLYVLVPLSFLLLVCLSFLIPAQHLEPLLVNHYPHGYVTVTPTTTPATPRNQAQIESDIVRYVNNRLSYSAYTYEEQYSLVNLLSSHSVAQQYEQSQSSHNKKAPINTLGTQGFRTVHIDSVLFLDNINLNNAEKQIKGHQNVAQIDFTITDHPSRDRQPVTTTLTALISWAYRGTPANPENAWRNWDGFSVTHFVVQPRNVEQTAHS